MAISFVGAGIIWKFVYQFQPNERVAEIGLLSQIAEWLGFVPTNWILTAPLNTFLLIVVFVWIQTGFAMVILSAAIKAILKRFWKHQCLMEQVVGRDLEK